MNQIVLFDSLKICIVQDCASRMLIGASEWKDELYYFRKVPSGNFFQNKW